MGSTDHQPHALEPTQILETVLRQAVVQTDADRGVFVEVDAVNGRKLRPIFRFPPEILRGSDDGYSSGVCGRVLESGAAIRAVDVAELASVLCVPVRIGRRIAGIVQLESATPNHFRKSHEARLESSLRIAEDMLCRLHGPAPSLRTVAESPDPDWSFGRFVGRSPAIVELGRTVQKVGPSDFPVLLLGETGTGKSITARILHHTSPRAERAFVTVFCPSLEKGMVETELFGHRRGAFTGAVVDRVGKVQAGERGTMFLDEIGDLPLDIQPKLLRLLQEKTFERVGDPKERTADTRVIAATSRDLERDAAEGRFRRDLYERLNFVPVRIPPIRERREDIPLLLRYFLKKSLGRPVELDTASQRFLVELDFAWPGNARHLEHMAARLALEPIEETVGQSDIRRVLDVTTCDNSPVGAARLDLDLGLPALLAESERNWLVESLERYPNLTRVELAEKLKISRAALYKKLKEYGLGSD